MTKPKRKPLRLDVHITLSDEQFERILAAIDDLGKVLGYGKKD